MKATEKDELLALRLSRAGLDVSPDETRTLRRAALTLRAWAEKECGGDGGGIERDETTGKCVWYSARTGTRTPTRDLETPALARVEAACARIGAYYYRQPNPRWPSLYVRPVALGPLTAANYDCGLAIY